MATMKITGGILAPYGVGRPCVFTLHSRDLTASPNLSAPWDTGLPLIGRSFKAGQSINVSGAMAGDQTLRSGPVFYKGTYFPQLWFTGSFAFAGTPVAAPANSTKPVSVRTKFEVTGSFSGFADNTLGETGPAVFSFTIAGKGQATLQLSASYISGPDKIRDQVLLVYAFK